MHAPTKSKYVAGGDVNGQIMAVNYYRQLVVGMHSTMHASLFTPIKYVMPLMKITCFELKHHLMDGIML